MKDNAARSFAVVIPAYNSAATISRAILSATACAAVEIVVVDDGSTDATSAIARSLNCTVVRQTNSGAAVARRVGLQAVDTQFVALLDADDELLPAGVESGLDAISKDDGSVGSIGRTLLRPDASAPEEYIELWAEGVTLKSLLERGQAPGPPGSFVWKTSQLREALNSASEGLWPRYAEDYEIVIRMAMRGRITSTTEPTCCYSISGGKSNLAPLRSLSAAEDIRRHYSAVNNIAIRYRSRSDLHALAEMRRAFGTLGRMRHARRAFYLGRAVLRSPMLFVHLWTQRNLRNRT